MISVIVMLKGPAAALVVGFVTASIKTWVDRFFLLIMRVGIVGLPISEAVLVNLVVVGLSALLMVFRQRKALGSAISAPTAAFLIIASAVAGGLTGFLSAGGKPFAVPTYNNAMGHHPQAAYAYASLGVVAAAWAALATQFGFISTISPADLILGLYEFALVTLVALVMNRLWSEKLNKIVNLTIAPIQIIVGVRFIIFAV